MQFDLLLSVAIRWREDACFFEDDSEGTMEGPKVALILQDCR